MTTLKKVSLVTRFAWAGISTSVRFESGTRFKILEAGACGVPIVSTTLGAAGIPVINKENILIADTESDFTDAITSLLNNQNETRRLASNCRKLIEDNYSINKAKSEAMKILEYLTDDPKRESENRKELFLCK